jgi:hypothetical protein
VKLTTRIEWLRIRTHVFFLASGIHIHSVFTLSSNHGRVERTGTATTNQHRDDEQAQAADQLFCIAWEGKRSSRDVDTCHKPRALLVLLAQAKQNRLKCCPIAFAAARQKEGEMANVSYLRRLGVSTKSMGESRYGSFPTSPAATKTLAMHQPASITVILKRLCDLLAQEDAMGASRAY